MNNNIESQQMKKSKRKNTNICLLALTIVCIIIVLAGVLLVRFYPSVDVEITRYINIDNQYDNQIILIFFEGNHYPYVPYIFRLNSFEKLENEKLGVWRGGFHPTYDNGIKVYEKCNVEKEDFLLDEKRFISKLIPSEDTWGFQSEEKIVIDQNIYIKILNNGTISFDLKSSRSFKLSEDSISEDTFNINIRNNNTIIGYSQISVNNIIISNISNSVEEMWYNYSHYGSMSEFSNELKFSIFEFNDTLHKYLKVSEKTFLIQFNEYDSIYVKYESNTIEIEYL